MSIAALPRVATVVVNWNRRDLTCDCLESLDRVAYPNHRVVVVDNDSSDGSADFIRARFPQAALIQSGGNLGYTGGNNLGIRWALEQDCDYVHLLNNDATVAPDAISKLVAAAEACPEIGIVGPKVLFYDPPDLVWAAGGRVDWKQLRGGGSAHLYYKRRSGEITGAPFDVDYVPGCSLMARRAAIERTGLLDPDFFAYCEDIDWAWRMRRAGYRIAVVPEAVVWHRVSSTAGGATSPFPAYMITRNQLLVHHKNVSSAQWLLYFPAYVLLIVPLEVLLASMRLVVRRSFRARTFLRLCRAYAMGVAHFLQRRFGSQLLP
jgi:hypothetical protein